MKKIFSLMLMVVSLFTLSGCNKVNFSYFEEKVNSIDGYKYYTISETIYVENLLLYESKKNVYLYNNLIKVTLDSININDLDSEDLYSENSSEYYVDRNNLYYFENNEWKVKENTSESSILGLDINKEMFESYRIYKEDGRDVFSGKLKNSSINDFFDFEITGVYDLILEIVLNGGGNVVLVSLSYVSSNGNDVVISLKPNYSYVMEFELPIVE